MCNNHWGDEDAEVIRKQLGLGFIFIILDSFCFSFKKLFLYPRACAVYLNDTFLRRNGEHQLLVFVLGEVL